MERWYGVEIRHLAALAAIDTERSFRGAADRLGYVQSAVSQQIAQLERLVGLRLVERTSGHAQVRLTSAGERTVDHAHRILAQLDAACAEIRDVAAGTRATVRLGTTQSLASNLLPRTLAILEAAFSEVAVSVHESFTDRELVGQLANAEIDVAIVELPLPEPFEFETLLVDPVVLVRSAEQACHQLSSLDELAGIDLIRSTNWQLHSLLESELHARGVKLRIRLGSTTDAGVQELVAAGLGAALMPRLSVDVTDPRVSVNDMDELLPARTVVAAWQPQSRPGAAVSALLRAAKRACADLAAERIGGLDPAGRPDASLRLAA